MGPSLRFLVAFTSALHVTTTAASSPATLSYDPVATALFKRQAQCPGDYFQCPTSLGAAFEDICCVNGQRCAFDENNQPACCPSGAVCTGTAPNPTQTDAPVSFVPNTYFTFPYAPTTFADSGACSSAVRACSRNYDSCASALGDGDRFAVTIDVPGGGGVTVDGQGPNLGATATLVCSSLSSEACSHLEETSCESYGSSAASTSFGPLSTSFYLMMGVAASLLLAGL